MRPGAEPAGGGPRRLPVDEHDPLTTSLDPREVPGPGDSVELVRRAQGGDDLALNDLFDRYRERLRRIVRIRLGARLREHVESMDIVQNTYEVAFRKIGDLEPRSTASILQWLSKIAEHKIHDANDYYFALKRDRGRELPYDPIQSGTGSRAPSFEPPADESLPEERAWRAELREILDDAMTQLSPDHREVILLRDYCGGEWEYVARQVGRDNVHAAQELHRRAWIHLRRIVRPRLK